MRACTGGIMIAVLLGGGACVPLQRPPAAAAELMLVPAGLAAASGWHVPGSESSGPAPTGVREAGVTPVTVALRIDIIGENRWIADRTVAAADHIAPGARAGIVAFGGPERNTADVLRVLHADSAGRERAAAAIGSAAGAERLDALLIVPEGLGPRDLEPLLGLLGAIAPAAREAGAQKLVLLVPPGDTTTYPTRTLARFADVLLIALDRQPPPFEPGPQVTTHMIRRAIAIRAAEAGAGRLALLLPLHGYLWMPDSLPRAISYDEAMTTARTWRVPLARDHESRMVTADAPAVGALWVPDAATVSHIVRQARMAGVRRFVFVIGAGEDPAAIAAAIAGSHTTSSSR